MRLRADQKDWATRGYLLQVLTAVFLFGVSCSHALAGGGRFTPGNGWGVPAYYNVYWNTTSLAYSTDAGALNSHVNHAQADAMVAAAAAVWNVPTSSISFRQSGELAEHVSTANTYFDGTQVVFPTDVQTTNEGRIPVAILYDTDGSVIDLLLGDGASEPDGCRQNAVVGDVDDIHQWNGIIAHATLILNGRCVGSAPEQLTQMQYQLARAFGRVLGLAWSQVNDNVFTGQTTITAQQMAYWPLMHPIDVICGNYSYQCMSNPFTLRVDDLNSLADLYPVGGGGVPAGKQASDDDALYFHGYLYFPTGQGMDWVNIATTRQNNGYTESWQTTSSITGSQYQQATGTPVNSTAAANSGWSVPGADGYFSFRRIPLNGVSNVFFTTEAINPLYTGEYAIGPYIRTPPTLSGSPATVVDWSARSAGDWPIFANFVASDAASRCNPGADGTESSPAPLDASGWQNGLFCGWGHSSWWSVPVAAGHTWTMEVTATDETGSASTYKALPVMGVWNASDATGTEPTVASQPVSFNSMSLGMTQMGMAAPDNDSTYRIALTDQYGAGRPDFTYTARMLYAASVLPTTVGSGGGQIVITGTGFRQGNQVLVNGAAARVLSWTATSIVADAPTMSAAGAQLGVPVLITVADASTGGSATIPDAVSYTVQPNVVQQVSAPASLETGVTAAVPFAIRVLASDGLSPVANESVSFAVVAGAAQLGVCGGALTCTVTTDEHGLVQTTVVGGSAGSVTLQATDVPGGASVQVVVADTDPARAVSFANPAHYVAAGASGTWTPVLQVQQDGQPAPNVSVTWSASPELTLGAAAMTTDASGSAQVSVSASVLAAGSVQTVAGCAWSSLCATWTLYGVDAADWMIGAPANATLSVPQGNALSPVTLNVTDGAGHALEGAPVQVYQRVLAWEGECAAGAGRCPAAPVLATSETTLTSDGNGAIEIAPLQVPGVPQVVQIAAVTGAVGFVTVTLVKTP